MFGQVKINFLKLNFSKKIVCKKSKHLVTIPPSKFGNFEPPNLASISIIEIYTASILKNITVTYRNKLVRFIASIRFYRLETTFQPK
jgi:hypothetical protein